MNPKETTTGADRCDLERIDRFLQSDHYHLEDTELFAHLDSCESCRIYMEGKAASSEMRDAATRLLQPNEFDTAGSVACSAATLDGQSGHCPHAVQDALDALTPSEYPNHLGRIGSYEVTGVVGFGAMGVVLKAIDPTLDRVVALKMMAPRLANSEVARKRFLREAKAAAAVLHPNVIPIHSVSSGGEIPYLVMSYVRGGSLQKRLRKDGPLPLVEVLRIGEQVAAGLEAAHAKGLVHRDIKPENILLEEGVERVTITDFGLARAVDDNTVTQQGTIAGTPMYMSPEQARGEQVDQQSDLFSLGSVLYALATGHPPFQADTSFGVMRRIIDESPRPIQELNPDIPDWFAGIVEKLMSSNAEDRFESAAEVHTVLDACLSHVQQPETTALPEIEGLAASSVRKQQAKTQRVRRLLMFASIAAAFIVAMFAVPGWFPKSPDGPFMVGGGSGASGDGWQFVSGCNYLKKDEPGVQFGMYQDPRGNRELLYVILFRHDLADTRGVKFPPGAGMSFDGEVASMKNGIGFDTRMVDLRMRIQLNKDKSAIESTSFSVDGETLDYSKGRLILVDLTSEKVTHKQVDARFPEDLLDPQDIVEDTSAVEALARKLAQLDGVRQFLSDRTGPEEQAAASVVTADNPDVPIVLSPTRAKIVRPEGWFSTTAHLGPRLTWIISVENTVGNKPYDTGVQIQAFYGVKKSTGKSPKRFLSEFLASKSEAHGVKVVNVGESTIGKYEILRLETDEGNNHVVYTMYRDDAGPDIALVTIAGTRKTLWEPHKETLGRIGNLNVATLNALMIPPKGLPGGTDSDTRASDDEDRVIAPLGLNIGKISNKDEAQRVVNALTPAKTDEIRETSGLADGTAGGRIKPNEAVGIDNAHHASAATIQLLIESVKQGNLKDVEAMLSAGVNPNGPPNKLTALHWAVAKRKVDGETVRPTKELVKRLLEAGANVNASDYLGQTPLEWATKHASPEIVETLLKAGADVNAISRYGTVLQSARSVEIATPLIEAGADVNAGTSMTPLAEAAKRGNLKLIQLLINSGANVNDPKHPALHWAGQPKVAAALIEAGADVNQANEQGETALHSNAPFYMGAWVPMPETVQLLIKADANVNARSKFGSTPLHAAASSGKAEIVKLLIAAGAEANAKDQQGNTPLSVARAALIQAQRLKSVNNEPYEATVSLLATTPETDDGRTKLQQAVAAGNLDEVTTLIASSVNVNETGPQSITAVHIASQNGLPKILEALINAGAKVDEPDAKRFRPLHLAANAEVARILITHGAKVNSDAPSPLYLATMNGRVDVVEELVRNKTDIKNSHCAGMLNWATFAGQTEVIKVLLEHREPNVLLAKGGNESPLHIATNGALGDMNCAEDVTPERRLAMARLLLESGADVNVRWGVKSDPRSVVAHMVNTTPLMFASNKGESRMVKLLLEHNADVKSVNKSGQTALHFAVQQGDHAVVEQLLEAKSPVNVLTNDGKTALDVATSPTTKVLLIQHGAKTALDLLKTSTSGRNRDEGR